MIRKNIFGIRLLCGKLTPALVPHMPVNTEDGCRHFKHAWPLQPKISIFSGRCSVTIFLTDLDGTVTQHDGDFLAVDGFPFFRR